ncbi:hypothetical protein EG850_00405 [Gulosibacter macacae]|uniref:Putative Flp pilus-assembly TadG-like N-terminal domain-containing protein n=1 Tax=Gulosibacter macacae TaxID=2488791 RepID=A0A3P3W0T6_9MICO|nr:pilus assembly protein TadG-related protein [Gulosibacter macacae]RRJ88645.1 hypothetical protein EG850_00405 [Gulosibacter macacae]
MRRLLTRDEGSVTPLILVYALIALAAGLLLTSAADLYLARKQLFSAADAAALAAVTRYELEAVTLVEGKPLVGLDTEQAAIAANDHLAKFGPTGAQVTAIAIDGDRIHLTVEATWTPVITSAFVPLAVPISVDVSARGRLE